MTKNIGRRIGLRNRPLVSFRVRNQVQLLALIAFLSLSATQSKATDENETVLASPDGTYELHQIVPENDSDDVKIFVVSTTTPKEKKLLGKVDMGTPVKGPVVVANGVLYVMTGKQLFAIEQK